MSGRSEKKFRKMHRAELETLAGQDFSKYHTEQKKAMQETALAFGKRILFWRVTTLVLAAVCAGLIFGLIVAVSK